MSVKRYIVPQGNLDSPSTVGPFVIMVTETDYDALHQRVEACQQECDEARAIFRRCRELFGVPWGDGVSILEHIEEMKKQHAATVADCKQLEATVTALEQEHDYLKRVIEDIRHVAKE